MLQRDATPSQQCSKSRDRRIPAGQEPRSITALDVLLTVESTLTEKADNTVEDRGPAIETALRELTFSGLDRAVEACLGRVTVQDLLDYSKRQRTE